MYTKTETNRARLVLWTYGAIALIIKSYFTHIIFIPFSIFIYATLKVKSKYTFFHTIVLDSLICSIASLFYSQIDKLSISSTQYIPNNKLLITFALCLLLIGITRLTTNSFYNLLNALVIEKITGSFIVQRFPNLLCTEHLTRTKIDRIDKQELVNCRINDNCINKKNIIYAKTVTGLIGAKKRNNKGIYYINVWDERTKSVRFADYDSIEIYRNKEIEDYNSIICKLISVIDNTLNKIKPLSDIKFTLYGDIKLAKNTIRLMNEKQINIKQVNNKRIKINL